jgi:carboxypeptidase T
VGRLGDPLIVHRPRVALAALALAAALAMTGCAVVPNRSRVAVASRGQPTLAPASGMLESAGPFASPPGPSGSPLAIGSLPMPTPLGSPSEPGSTTRPTPVPIRLPAVTDPDIYSRASFPFGYRAYHTYAQMAEHVLAVARAHPDLVDLVSIGRSFQGATLLAARVSQDVHVDHGRPEALFDGLHHGLEHMSLEMTLRILDWLVDGYGREPSITRLLQTRAVDIVFAVNPDGAMYDIQGGVFHAWRKNRQPGPGGQVGTDLNRNYADHWGCCGLVSANPASPYYRGRFAFSAPETRAFAAFVRSRVISGRQRITVAITFHTSGRLILWPYGYTHTAVASDMTPDDHAVFVALGRAMAARDGYRPEQASKLYVDSGTARDWEYGRQHIFAFTFELATGTYQPSSAIGPETSRNRSAVLYLIAMADCPYRAIGKQAQYCR